MNPIYCILGGLVVMALSAIIGHNIGYRASERESRRALDEKLTAEQIFQLRKSEQICKWLSDRESYFHEVILRAWGDAVPAMVADHEAKTAQIVKELAVQWKTGEFTIPVEAN